MTEPDIAARFDRLEARVADLESLAVNVQFLPGTVGDVARQLGFAPADLVPGVECDPDYAVPTRLEVEA